MKTDCISFDEDEEGNVSCLSRGYFICKEKLEQGETMCENCRLWDDYIPETATKAEIDKAVEWQNMPWGEQPDYEQHFNL